MGRERCVTNPDVLDFQESISAKDKEDESWYWFHPKLHHSELHVIVSCTEFRLIEVRLLHVIMLSSLKTQKEILDVVIHNKYSF